MALPPLIKQVDQKLEGWPDQTLTIALLGMAIVIGLIALFANPTIKAVALAWVVMP